MSRIFVPRPWQLPIIEHEIDVRRCGVWAGMGLGKSVATLTSLDYMYLAGELSGPTLVVAPLRVASSTWPDEAKKWGHLRHIEVVAIVGDAPTRLAALKRALRANNASIYTINFENLTWLEEALATLKVQWPFRTVVADESTKLKGFRTKQGGARAKSLGRVAHKSIGDTKLVTRFIELTGTPASNGLKDLWGQVWYLDGGERLGRSYTAFMQRWFQKGFDGFSYDPLPFAQAQIEAKLRDICLTLDIRDYVQLDEPIVHTIYVDLPPKARARYAEMEKKMYTEISGRSVEAFSAAGRTNKCLQLANGAVYVDPNADSDEHAKSKEWKEVHDVKIQALEDIVEEAAGAPVLVAYHFKSDLARLKAAFPKGRALDANPGTIAAWNAGKIPILFAHPASAGHGLNLQDGGNIVAFFGHWWDLEHYQQIIERIGPTRQFQAGHNRAVFIYLIVARDTVDEDVIARRDSKRSVQEILLESCKRKGIK